MTNTLQEILHSGVFAMQVKDLNGMVFGRWVVLGPVPGRRLGQARWLCRCACGTEKVQLGATLRGGLSKSCGCYRAEAARLQRGLAKPKQHDGLRSGRLAVITRDDETSRIKKRSYFLCLCDCGNRLSVQGSSLTSGRTKSCGCLQRETTAERSRGANNYGWKGGRRRTPEGYIRLTLPDHPNANAAGSVAEHTVVMAKHIGRPIAPHESIHHKNGIRDDNRIENLELWATKHMPGQRVTDLVAFAREVLAEYGDLAL